MFDDKKVDIRTTIVIEFPRMEMNRFGGDQTTIHDIEEHIRGLFMREVAAPLALQGATTSVDVEIIEVP